jgi:hypothetical protein
MTCEEFLKKWTFLPPIRYCFGIYSVRAYYITKSFNEENKDLNQLLKNIDAIMEEKYNS